MWEGDLSTVNSSTTEVDILSNAFSYLAVSTSHLHISLSIMISVISPWLVSSVDALISKGFMYAPLNFDPALATLDLYMKATFLPR